MHRPLAIAAAAAALALASLAPAQAATQGTVIIQSGPTIEYRNLPSPPPPRMVARPGMRHGQVWVDGHWEWRGTRYRWIDGYWTKASVRSVFLILDLICTGMQRSNAGSDFLINSRSNTASNL